MDRIPESLRPLWPHEPRWHETDAGRMHYVDLGPRDAAVGLEATDHRRLVRTVEPIARGHGRAVVEQRMVADDDGVAVATADDDLVPASGTPAEQLGDPEVVGVSGGVHR